MLICQDQRSGIGCRHPNPNGAVQCAQCGRSLIHALRAHDSQDLIGTYRVLGIVGSGGFGVVYSAEDTRQPGTLVALKESFDPISVRSFRDEFAILHQFTHPHLPAYHDVFEAQGNGYLVMELIEGQNLEQILHRRQGPLLETQVLGYIIQLCNALSFLHSQQPPILHRDIKPANIRLTAEGVIKLVDFGLVKLGVGTTATSRRGATLAYAPIEQYGGIANTDSRSDIYALGATLYHLLTGQEPVAAPQRIAQSPDPLQNPRAINPHISASVAEAIVKAMSIPQNSRYPTITEFQKILLDPKSMQNSGAVTALPTQPQCKHCGALNTPSTIYCQQCARMLRGEQRGAHCKHNLPVGALFCPTCGKPA